MSRSSFSSGLLIAALAASAALTATAPAQAQSAAEDVRKEARQRFDRGLRLFNQGDNNGALAEFKRAYELVPHPMVLFNLTLVHAARNDPVKAVDAADRLLSNPGEIGAERVQRVQSLRAEQAGRIGLVAIQTNVDGASVEVDGVEVGKTPVTEPLKVSSGSHVVGIVAPGYSPVRRQITVAGQSQANVNVELQALEGRLAHLEVKTNVPGAVVSVDGTPVGETPLPASLALAPGSHSVEVKRPGYQTVRKTMNLGDGAAGELPLELQEDPAALGAEGGMLALDITEEESVIFIDGAARGPYAGPMRLAHGAHRLKIERADFIPYERDVDVKKGGTTILPVELQPTPEYRADYRSSAKRRRMWSWVAIGSGAALTVGGTVFVIINKKDQDDKKQTFETAFARYEEGGPCDPRTQPDPADNCTRSNADGTPVEVALAISDLEDARDMEKFGWIGLGVGAALATTGVILLALGDDPDRYEPKEDSDVFASRRVIPTGWMLPGGGGGAGLVGTF